MFDGAIDAAVDAANNVRQRLSDRSLEPPAATAPPVSPSGPVPPQDRAFEQIPRFDLTKAVDEALKQRASDLARIDEQIARTVKQFDENLADRRNENARALERRSDEALRQSDIRSGGIDEILRIATGRTDPGLEENRKQTAELNKISRELRELRSQRVEILGFGARA